MTYPYPLSRINDTLLLFPLTSIFIISYSPGPDIPRFPKVLCLAVSPARI
jgi:hypothetical protein